MIKKTTGIQRFYEYLPSQTMIFFYPDKIFASYVFFFFNIGFINGIAESI